jgi:hypothetical protein
MACYNLAASIDAKSFQVLRQCLHRRFGAPSRRLQKFGIQLKGRQIDDV